jgi:hypothetical protein
MDDSPPFFWISGFSFLVHKGMQPNDGKEKAGESFVCDFCFLETAHKVFS